MQPVPQNAHLGDLSTSYQALYKALNNGNEDNLPTDDKALGKIVGKSAALLKNTDFTNLTDAVKVLRQALEDTVTRTKNAIAAESVAKKAIDDAAKKAARDALLQAHIAADNAMNSKCPPFTPDEAANFAQHVKDNKPPLSNPEKALIDELRNTDDPKDRTKKISFAEGDIIEVGKTKPPVEKIVFLEKGLSTAQAQAKVPPGRSSGFAHIIEEHGDEFSTKGIPLKELSSFVMKAVTEGTLSGNQGAGNGRPIYDYLYNGRTYSVAVTVGDNGYIVGANLAGVK